MCRGQKRTKHAFLQKVGVDNAKATRCRIGKGDTYLQSFTQNEMQVWLCWTIFVIKIVCAPLNLIFGGVFFNESSEEEHLPALMVAGGLLEVASHSHQYAPGTHIFLSRQLNSHLTGHNILTKYFNRYLGFFLSSSYMCCFLTRG